MMLELGFLHPPEIDDIQDELQRIKDKCHTSIRPCIFNVSVQQFKEDEGSFVIVEANKNMVSSFIREQLT